MSAIRDLTAIQETSTVVSSALPLIKNITTYYKLCGLPNTQPQVDTIRIQLQWNSTYSFTEADITNQYSDAEADLPLSVKITSLPTKGSVTFNGQSVVIGQIIYFTDITSLQYTPPTDQYGLYYTSFNIKVNDDGIAPNPYSEDALVIIDVIANTPPSVGNSTICLISDQVYTFTLSDFTTNYQDNQNDSPFQVQIKTLPTNGILLFNNIAVVAGQIIDLSNIQQLTYQAPPQGFGTPYTSFTFCVNDQGSQLFSQDQTLIINVNVRPFLSDITISINQDTQYLLDQGLFQSLFTDIDGNQPQSVKIVGLPANGLLTYNGIAVLLDQIIPINALSIFNLLFTPVVGEFANNYAQVRFEIQDNSLACPAWSEDGFIQFNVLQVDEQVNQLPTITPVGFTVCNQQQHQFNWIDFEQQYTDPELTPLTSIRIESIPPIGSLQFNGTPVAIQQIITQANINQLVYVAPNQGPQNTLFSWSASDQDGGWSNASQVNITIDDCTQLPAFTEISVAEGTCDVPDNELIWTVVYINQGDSIQNGTILYTDQQLTVPYFGNQLTHRIKDQNQIILDFQWQISAFGALNKGIQCNEIPPSFVEISVAQANCEADINSLVWNTVYISSLIGEGTVVYVDQQLSIPYNGSSLNHRVRNQFDVISEFTWIISGQGVMSNPVQCIDDTYTGLLQVDDCFDLQGPNVLITTSSFTVGATVRLASNNLPFAGANLLYLPTAGGMNQDYDLSQDVLITANFLIRVDNQGIITQTVPC